MVFRLILILWYTFTKFRLYDVHRWIKLKMVSDEWICLAFQLN